MGAPFSMPGTPGTHRMSQILTQDKLGRLMKCAEDLSRRSGEVEHLVYASASDDADHTGRDKGQVVSDNKPHPLVHYEVQPHNVAASQQGSFLLAQAGEDADTTQMVTAKRSKPRRSRSKRPQHQFDSANQHMLFSGGVAMAQAVIKPIYYGVNKFYHGVGSAVLYAHDKVCERVSRQQDSVMFGRAIWQQSISHEDSDAEIPFGPEDEDLSSGDDDDFESESSDEEDDSPKEKRSETSFAKHVSDSLFWWFDSACIFSWWNTFCAFIATASFTLGSLPISFGWFIGFLGLFGVKLDDRYKTAYNLVMPIIKWILALMVQDYNTLSVPRKLDVLLAWAPAYNSYDAQDNPLPFGWDRTAYEEEVQKLTQVLRADPSKYQAEFKRLNDNPTLNRLFRPTIRMQPYSVTFQGDAGVGKTRAMDVVMHALFPIACPGEVFDERKVSTLNPDGKFDNQTTTATQVIKLNDVSFVVDDEADQQTLRTVQRIVDNVTEEIQKADVDSKGKHFYSNKLTFITTNNKNVVNMKATEPNAFYRRIGYKVVVSVVDEFKEGTTLSASKVYAAGLGEEHPLGVNRFTVQRFKRGEQNSILWETVEWDRGDGKKIKLEDIDYDDLLPFLMEDAARHFAEQRRYMENRHNVMNYMCPARAQAPHTHVLKHLCVECNPSVAANAPSELIAHAGIGNVLQYVDYTSAVEGAMRVLGMCRDKYAELKETSKGSLDATKAKAVKVLDKAKRRVRKAAEKSKDPWFWFWLGSFYFSYPEMIGYYIMFRYSHVVYGVGTLFTTILYFNLTHGYWRAARYDAIPLIICFAIYFFAEKAKRRVWTDFKRLLMIIGGYWLFRKLMQLKVSQGGYFSFWNPNGEMQLNTSRNLPGSTLFNRYKKNTCVLKLQGSTPSTYRVSHAFGVKGGILLVHRHFINQLSDINRAEMVRDGVTYNIVIEKSAVIDIGLEDIVGLVIDNLHPFHDMVADFPEEKMTAGGGIMVGCSLDQHSWGEPCMIPVTGVKFSPSHYQLPSGFVTSAQEGYSYTTGETTRVGMCASPIISTNRNESYIYGLHSAGKDKEGFCVSITRPQVVSLIERADRLFPGVGTSRAQHVDLGDGAKPLTQDTTAFYANQSGIELTTRSPDAIADAPVAASRNKMLTKVSVYADAVGEVFSYPSDKFMPVSNKCHGLYQNHLANCGKGSELSITEVREAAKDLVTKLNANVDFSHIRPISLEENLNGYSFMGTKVPGINVNTSAGKILGGKKFTHMDFERLEGGRLMGYLKEEEKNLYDAFRDELRHGRLDPKWTWFSLTIKDEARTKPEGRIFAAGPMFLILAMREYFSTIAECLSRNPRHAESFVGSVVMGPDWDDLYDYLAEFGTDRCQDGDFSKFDTSFSTCLVSQAMKIMIDVARASSKYGNEDIVAMQTISEAIVYPICLGDGHYRYYGGFGPSGHSLTVIVNNLINSIYIRCMYNRIIDSHRFPFNENVNFVAYGDDNIFSISDRVSAFTHERISQEFAACGIKYTSASKDGKTYDLKSIGDCSFLKRRWVHNKDLVVAGNSGMDCPIEFDSIMKSLLITKPSVTSFDEQITQTFRSAEFEFSYYGEDAYNENILKLIRLRDIMREDGVANLWEPYSYRTILDKRIADRRERYVETP